MNKDYVFATLFVTMSCTTSAVNANQSLLEYEKGVYPMTLVEIPFEQDKYVMNSRIPSYVPTSQSEDLNDFEVLVSFANKMLDNEVGIDLEIQHVINNSFWDML